MVQDKMIESPRLTFEPLVPSHASRLYEPFLDPELYLYIPQEPPVSLERLAARYALLEARRSPDGVEVWLNWAIRLRNSDCYVGVIQATVFPDRSAQAAYFIFRPHWRRGYAKEACARILEHLAMDYGVERVWADVDTRNVASIRLLESLGFQREKLTVSADFFKGSSSDEFRYARKYPKLPVTPHRE